MGEYFANQIVHDADKKVWNNLKKSKLHFLVYKNNQQKKSGQPVFYV